MQARCFDRGFFAFFWQTMGVHDYFQYAEQTDLQYYLILRAMQRRNILERTLVLILSDHGLRYGPFVNSFQGMRETSLPTLVAIYPRWLAKRFPLAVENLRANLLPPFCGKLKKTTSRNSHTEKHSGHGATKRKKKTRMKIE